MLLFDYRHFGANDGLLRQLVSVRQQLAGWAAAIAFSRRQPGVDPDRIVLWGTSFSGGHVVVAAARDGRVAALCAQGPMMDGLAATLNIIRHAGIGQVLRLAARGLRDLAQAAMGCSRVPVALVGAPGSLAVSVGNAADTRCWFSCPADKPRERPVCFDATGSSRLLCTGLNDASLRA